MLTLIYTVVGLLATTACATASKHSTPNVLAGTWDLARETRTYPNGTTITPLGLKPYGRLIFTPGLYYTQQSNRADYASHPWEPTADFFQPGTAAENAALVRDSFAVSGVYRVDENGEYAGITTKGCIIPNFIGMSLGPPTQTFTVRNGGKELVERINSEGGGGFEYVWERLE